MSIGDAYLKYAASTFFFVTMVERREGPLHTARSQVVSNRALHFGAVTIDLPPYIQSKPLMPKIWSPSVSEPREHGEDHYPGAAKVGQPGQVNKSERQPKLSKRQKQVEDQMVQWLGDKVDSFGHIEPVMSHIVFRPSQMWSKPLLALHYSAEDMISHFWLRKPCKCRCRALTSGQTSRHVFQY